MAVAFAEVHLAWGSWYAEGNHMSLSGERLSKQNITQLKATNLLQLLSTFTALKPCSPKGDLSLDLNYALSGISSLTYQESRTPDNIAQRVIMARKPLHYDKVRVQEKTSPQQKCWCCK